jgi:hypothetical protein
MNKRLISAAFAGVLASGFLAVSVPTAQADPAPCMQGGPGTDGMGGPACQACVVNTPAAQSSAVCFGRGQGAQPDQNTSPNADCASMLEGSNPSVGAYQGCIAAHKATGQG